MSLITFGWATLQSLFNGSYCAKTFPYSQVIALLAFLINVQLSLPVFFYRCIFICVSLKCGFSPTVYSLSFSFFTHSHSNVQLSVSLYLKGSCKQICLFQPLFSAPCSLLHISTWISHRVSNSVCSKLKANDNFKIEQVVH